jgi:hypothetical protein
MRGKSESWGWAMLATALLGPAALAQPAPQAAPPDRIGPVWDFRDYEPTPAEIQARERARGMPQTGQSAETQEVDQLYRELIGSDPKAPPANTSRERDRQ